MARVESDCFIPREMILFKRVAVLADIDKF